MLIDYIRQVHAEQNFKLKDNFDFISFDDLTSESISEEHPVPENIEIWAAIKVFFAGELPTSYKILNLTIGDWVSKHEKEITRVLHDSLKNHFETMYPGSDASEFNGEEDSSIWEDQLDYMPRIDEEDDSLIIEIELVLDAEPIELSEDDLIQE